MNEPQAPAGARWDAPGWAEIDPDDTKEIAALKAALESASQRAEQWQEAHNLLDDECEANKKEIGRLQQLNAEHRLYADRRQRQFISLGFAFGILAALALFGALAWFRYV